MYIVYSLKDRKTPGACSGVFQLHLFNQRIEAFRRLD